MKSGYIPTIGLEIHAQLNTQTKMFCDSKNDPDESRVNVNVCPICISHPGTLPAINKRALYHVLRVGVAVKGQLADYTEFDRKNYFYPDIPKGYQISQYKLPLVSRGRLAGVDITRIHLEEDTARSVHVGGVSVIDFNRAGVPLMELVTEPSIHTTAEAVNFARELQLLLRYLEVGEANMEKGEMRVEANISVSNNNELGTKVEIKNLNSFKAVEKSINVEVERQIEILERGERVVQETRGWDEIGENTFSQRIKEESHDYRYFPDPDLPKLVVSQIEDFEKDVISENLPELPYNRRVRYLDAYGLTDKNADLFVSNRNLGNFFDNVVRIVGEDDETIRLAANYLSSDVVGMMNNNDMGELTPDSFSKILLYIKSNKLSSRGAKELLAHLFHKGGDPDLLIEELGLIQSSNRDEIQVIASQVVNEFPDVVDEYKQGKENAIKFLMGQGMKKSKGTANPQILEEQIKSEIESRV